MAGCGSLLECLRRSHGHKSPDESGLLLQEVNLGMVKSKAALIRVQRMCVVDLREHVSRYLWSGTAQSLNKFFSGNELPC